MPVELLRNICYFIDNNGMAALKTCFAKASLAPDRLPITTAHFLFSIIYNVTIRLKINLIKLN